MNTTEKPCIKCVWFNRRSKKLGECQRYEPRVFRDTNGNSITKYPMNHINMSCDDFELK